MVLRLRSAAVAAVLAYQYALSLEWHRSNELNQISVVCVLNRTLQNIREWVSIQSQGVNTKKEWKEEERCEEEKVFELSIRIQ